MTRVLAAAALLAAACSPAKRRGDDDPSAIRIDAEHAVVRVGTVGAQAPETRTYVLVDASNRSAVDRLVTIGGQLLDGQGAVAAELPPDELRIPAGGTRTYALVARAPAPADSRPRLRVLDALSVDYPQEVALSDAQTKHGDLTVATAVAKNVIDREVSAVVAATFYDARGAILGRPFTLVGLAPGATQQLRFEGPKDAARAVIFVGQVAFH